MMVYYQLKTGHIYTQDFKTHIFIVYNLEITQKIMLGLLGRFATQNFTKGCLSLLLQ